MRARGRCFRRAAERVRHEVMPMRRVAMALLFFSLIPPQCTIRTA